MDEFNEHQFNQQVSTAVSNCRKILENTRNPQQPADVTHTYTDKFHLAEFLTNTTLAAQLTILEQLGVTPELVKKFKEWSRTRSVTLRFSGEERCVFDRKVEREVESATKRVTEITGIGKGVSITDKVITKVTEWFWKFSASYQFSVYQGNLLAEQVVIKRRETANYELKTSVDSTPKAKVSSVGSYDVDLTWLFQNLSDNLQCSFNIDRTQKSCHTPRRNREIENAMNFVNRFSSWSGNIERYFLQTLFPVQTNHGIDISESNENIFVPVLPLFEEIRSNLDKAEEKSVIFSVADVNLFLQEHRRSIEGKNQAIERVFPSNNLLITPAEGKLVALNKHNQSLVRNYTNAVNYIESMLHKQLVAAIGKEVQPSHFNEYMIFHNRKLFKAQYEPRKFCYAIRRPDHYPEGILSIEADSSDGSIKEPITSIVHHAIATSPMNFSINAATNISFFGDRFLHAYVATEFSSQSGNSVNLFARARQFSSFIVLLGRIISATKFDPKYAFIVKNKDDIKVPLDFEQIPTAQQFRDAIESLSPEQQAFAKAFRSMQLESTLFAVCVIQIKPQLEKLLNLPADSLTKEIQLSEDLQDLFIQYQIPSDLLSYAGKADALVGDKINVVKNQVAAMFAMIKKSKEREIEEQNNIRAYENNITIDYDDSPRKEKVVKKRKCAKKKESKSVDVKSKISKRESAGSAPTPAAPSPAPTPSSAPQVDASASGGESKKIEAGYEAETTEDGSAIDYTQIPTQLDQLFEELDEDSSMHPTIINVGSDWEKKYQKALLAAPATEYLDKTKQESERNRAFDLLDALSRSGVLPVDEASLHVVIASTHTFDKTVMKTLIQDNVNPIDKVEKSTLIIASTIHSLPASELIKPEHIERVQQHAPKLFL